jgi:hypothetical protein
MSKKLERILGYSQVSNGQDGTIHPSSVRLTESLREPDALLVAKIGDLHTKGQNREQETKPIKGLSPPAVTLRVYHWLLKESTQLTLELVNSQNVRHIWMRMLPIALEESSE